MQTFAPGEVNSLRIWFRSVKLSPSWVRSDIRVPLLDEIDDLFCAGKSNFSLLLNICFALYKDYNFNSDIDFRKFGFRYIDFTSYDESANKASRKLNKVTQLVPSWKAITSEPNCFQNISCHACLPRKLNIEAKITILMSLLSYPNIKAWYLRLRLWKLQIGFGESISVTKVSCYETMECDIELERSSSLEFAWKVG